MLELTTEERIQQINIILDNQALLIQRARSLVFEMSETWTKIEDEIHKLERKIKKENKK